MIEVGLAGQIVVGLIAGLLVGAFHFSSLWWNTQFFTTGAAGKAIALQLGRIAVAVAVLTLLARLLGLAALLSGALGFLVARPLLLALWRLAMNSPLQTTALFHMGPVAITEPVIVTWAIMAFLTLFAIAVTRRLSFMPSKAQTILELFVSAIDGQIGDTMQVEPGPYRALIGTIFIFILIANWSSLIPGIEAPTAHLETDAAFGAIVFCSTIFYGVRALGLSGYLKTFTNPTWVMIPLNIAEQFTRTFSLIIRLFGNVMSGVFIGAIVLSLAGLFVPIPFMALDLLTGAIQAYIFTVLAMVYIGAALAEGRQEPPTTPNRK